MLVFIGHALFVLICLIISLMAFDTWDELLEFMLISYGIIFLFAGLVILGNYILGGSNDDSNSPPPRP